jgi:hypothetical protein
MCFSKNKIKLPEMELLAYDSDSEKDFGSAYAFCEKKMCC